MMLLGLLLCVILLGCSREGPNARAELLDAARPDHTSTPQWSQVSGAAAGGECYRTTCQGGGVITCDAHDTSLFKVRFPQVLGAGYNETAYWHSTYAELWDNGVVPTTNSFSTMQPVAWVEWSDDLQLLDPEVEVRLNGEIRATDGSVNQPSGYSRIQLGLTLEVGFKVVAAHATFLDANGEFVECSAVAGLATSPFNVNVTADALTLDPQLCGTAPECTEAKAYQSGCRYESTNIDPTTPGDRDSQEEVCCMADYDCYFEQLAGLDSCATYECAECPDSHEESESPGCTLCGPDTPVGDCQDRLPRACSYPPRPGCCNDQHPCDEDNDYRCYREDSNAPQTAAGWCVHCKDVESLLAQGEQLPPDLADFCDDGNECTDDACTWVDQANNHASCVHTPKSNGTVCSGEDGVGVDNECTDGECIAGVCTALFNDADCDDGNACTGYEDPDNPENSAPDVCVNGTCTPGPPLSCDDLNVCTDDACDPGTGCANTPNSSSCDDYDACTNSDHCEGGTCEGSAVDCGLDTPCVLRWCNSAMGCQQAPRAVCEDNPCETSRACDENTGVCSGTPVDCDDGDACTHDYCDVSIPQGCVHDPVTCDDGITCTEDTCDAVEGCQYNGPDCYDGDPCTQDVCDLPGHCDANPPPVDCDDGDECTDDSCDHAIGCVNLSVDCDDGSEFPP